MHAVVRPLPLLAALLLLAGCAEKARTISLAAVQFQAEAVAAVDLIDEMRLREVTAPPLSEAERSKSFVDTILNNSGEITSADLDELADPLGLDLGGSEDAWTTYLAELRAQYVTFASIFRNLEAGSLFAAPAVGKAVEPLERLTAQMLALAKSVEANPPSFLRERSALALELEQVRDLRAGREVKAARLQLLERELHRLIAAERQMATRVTEQAVKTARLGIELRMLLLNYDRLNVTDLTEGISFALTTAGALTGRDFGSLQTEADAILEQFRTDPGLMALFDAAAGRLAAARAGAGGA